MKNMTQKQIMLLIFSIVKMESNFEIEALSHAGAEGLMQLMPRTGQELHSETLCGRDYNPYDPDWNILLGSRYIRKLIKRYYGNYKLALVAYNWGMGNLDRILNDVRIEFKLGDPSEVSFIRVISRIPRETETYVKRVSGYFERISKGVWQIEAEIPKVNG